MDIKTLEQALKLQNDLTTRLTQSQAMQRTGKMPGIEALIKEKEQLLGNAQTEVDNAIKERDLAVSRWDERVAQRKANTASLQKELSDLKTQLAQQKDIAKVKKTDTIKKTGG
jgi:hypothetical protein